MKSIMKSLSTRTRNSLLRAGYKKQSEVKAALESGLLQRRKGLGKVGIAEIRGLLGMVSPATESRDKKERLLLWYTYGDERRCCGGHLINRQYCCLHCGSSDPLGVCLKEGVKKS